jgi:phospholipid/cholesterol/gamma-HCH transport system permease protein
MSEIRQKADLKTRREKGQLIVYFLGAWIERAPQSWLQDLQAEIELQGDLQALCLDAEELSAWDSTLLVAVRQLGDWAEARGLCVRLDGLPVGVQNLISLSRAVPENEQVNDNSVDGFFTHLGERSLAVYHGLNGYFEFLGLLLLDMFEWLRGRGRVRGKDLLILLQATGAQAVPIVTLLSFLTGLIIAFIGVIQLQKFAADIYVADLVGLAITRELGAVMTGVIMAGRTGAAFAAQIGSMQVNEEVDALTTFGISSMQFLVLPRVIALVLMMPLLCACSDFMGILGGMVVAVSISDVSILQYCNQIQMAVDLNDLSSGLLKSGVFGLIIALAGSYRGLNCGRDAGAVGEAATSAVVTSITWIVVADAIFAVMFHILGF